jgi:hypothetical protein
MKWCYGGSIPMDLEANHTMGFPGWQARETQLLLSVLDRALNRIALAASCQDAQRASQYLSQALDSYGSRSPCSSSGRANSN